jgi:hypothetical protein
VQLASELWLQQVKTHPRSADLRRWAASAIQYCAPEQAEAMLIEAQDEADLGRLYAAAALGITGLSYWNNDPARSDATFRERAFAQKARGVLEVATDKNLLVAAATGLLRDGAILWADGKLDWDYTPLGNSLLARAKAAAPEHITLFALPTGLPERGERPPIAIVVGGNVQQALLTRRSPPVYPANARQHGIQGTVRMSALIGPDGKVVRLYPESGPPELFAASLDTAKTWEYRPSKLNGTPCYVLTQLEVNYILMPQ